MSSAHRSLTTISKIDPSHSLTVNLYFFIFLHHRVHRCVKSPSVFMGLFAFPAPHPPLKHSMRVGTLTSWSVFQAPDIGLGGET